MSGIKESGISMSNPSCPSCESRKTARFMYWSERREWCYCCRETDIEGEGRSCGNVWIESERCPFCEECRLPLYIDLRRQTLGYWCKGCDRYPLESVRKSAFSLESPLKEGRCLQRSDFPLPKEV